MLTPQTTTSSISKGVFLGYKDRIVVATTKSKGICEVQLLDFDEDYPSSQGFCQCQFSFNGRYNALEVCALPNQTKTLLVLATSLNKGIGDIHVIELKDTDNTDETSKSTAFLVHDTKDNAIIQSAYTSLAFDYYSGHLYSASDTGDITIRDFHTFQSVFSFKPDACGVKEILCLPTREILITGNSYNSQIQLWDSRSNQVTKSFSIPLTTTTTSDASSFSSSRSSIGLTGCATVNNDTIVCGTSEGYILKWDIRNDRLLYDGKSHTSKVTSLRIHPSKPSIVFSTSSDGKAVCTYTEGNRSADYGYDLSTSNTEVIVSDFASLTSCDVEKQSQTVLITSSLGGLWRQSLAPVWQNQTFLSLT